MIWLLILLVMVGAIALGAYSIRQLQRDPKPVEDLQKAMDDLNVAIGKAFEPVLRRVAAALLRWNRR